MKVIKFKKLEGCIDGTNVVDMLLSDSISGEFVNYLGKAGKLAIYESLEKPLFTLIVRAKFTMKGVIGNKTVRVILPDSSGETEINEIIDFIGGY